MGAGATFGASKLWKDPQIPTKKSPLEELASGLQEVLGGLSALQGAVEGLRDRLDRQQETLQKQQELLQVMQLEDGGVKEIKQEIQSIKAIVIGRLAKPLDGKGNEEETNDDQEEVIKEVEAPVRVPELIFQDGQWVQAGDA